MAYNQLLNEQLNLGGAEITIVHYFHDIWIIGAWFAAFLNSSSPNWVNEMKKTKKTYQKLKF